MLKFSIITSNFLQNFHESPAWRKVKDSFLNENPNRWLQSLDFFQMILFWGNAPQRTRRFSILHVMLFTVCTEHCARRILVQPKQNWPSTLLAFQTFDSRLRKSSRIFRNYIFRETSDVLFQDPPMQHTGSVTNSYLNVAYY